MSSCANCGGSSLTGTSRSYFLVEDYLDGSGAPDSVATQITYSQRLVRPHTNFRPQPRPVGLAACDWLRGNFSVLTRRGLNPPHHWLLKIFSTPKNQISLHRSLKPPHTRTYTGITLHNPTSQTPQTAIMGEHMVRNFRALAAVFDELEDPSFSIALGS